MDAAQALGDLTEISAQIEAAAVATADGAPLASTLPDGAGGVLARAASGLLAEAGERAVAVEAAVGRSRLVAARDGSHLVAAVTSRGTPAGLVLYDLRTCLRRLAEAEAKPKPKPRRRRAPAKKKKQDAERESS